MVTPQEIEHLPQIKKLFEEFKNLTSMEPGEPGRQALLIGLCSQLSSSGKTDADIIRMLSSEGSETMDAAISRLKEILRSNLSDMPYDGAGLELPSVEQLVERDSVWERLSDALVVCVDSVKLPGEDMEAPFGRVEIISLSDKKYRTEVISITELCDLYSRLH